MYFGGVVVFIALVIGGYPLLCTAPLFFYRNIMFEMNVCTSFILGRYGELCYLDLPMRHRQQRAYLSSSPSLLMLL